MNGISKHHYDVTVKQIAIIYATFLLGSIIACFYASHFYGIFFVIGLRLSHFVLVEIPVLVLARLDVLRQYRLITKEKAIVNRFIFWVISLSYVSVWYVLVSNADVLVSEIEQPGILCYSIMLMPLAIVPFLFLFALITGSLSGSVGTKEKNGKPHS